MAQATADFVVLILTMVTWFIVHAKYELGLNFEPAYHNNSHFDLLRHFVTGFVKLLS